MAVSRPAVTLRLSAGLRDKVLRSGYSTVADLCSIPILDLAADLKLSNEQAEELAQELHPASSKSWRSLTAYQTLEQEKKWTPISTSSTAIDGLFGGGRGVPPGKITEICGLAGTGKTQLGLQLCINVQLPPSVGGAGGTSIYVDSEGSFVAGRVKQLARACSEKLARLELHDTPALDVENVLRGIQYCRVHSPVELIAMVRMLGDIVQSHPKTKLVVVDSIAFLFRSNFQDMNARTKLIAVLARQLAAVARKYDIAVVVMNQMTTKMESPQTHRIHSISSRSGEQIQPALGETWANMCTHRIRLQCHADGRRSARLFKSPTIQEQSVPFQIVSTGIADGEDFSPHAFDRALGEDMGFGFEPEETALIWDSE